jgi:hypothetical protein
MVEKKTDIKLVSEERTHNILLNDKIIPLESVKKEKGKYIGYLSVSESELESLKEAGYKVSKA